MLDLISFAPSKEQDPEGALLKATIAAHLACEHRRAVRDLFVGLVTAVSVLLWLAAAWPGLLPGELRRLALSAWALCFAGIGAASLSELRWHRRRGRLIATLAPTEAAMSPSPQLPKAVAARRT